MATGKESVGIIALNRPSSRNALTLDMVEAFAVALEDFRNDDRVTAVVVRSTSEGMFCAGGDVRAVCRARRDGRDAEADAFFVQEFALNERIARFGKPYIALIDGVCFGGGMGISIHGRHRVVGESARLAMPETAIGYFPDVGATHFFNRLPSPTARFLALTGYVLSSADALFTGLATHFFAGVRHGEIESRLANGEPVETILQEPQPPQEKSRLARHQDVVDRCFATCDISSIMDALRRERGAFAAEALEKLLRAAPSSLDTTLDLLERTDGLSLAQCLAIELDLALKVTRSQNFAEGVRALLVDKDRNPRWFSAEPRHSS